MARCVGRAETVPFTDADLDALASSLARREFQPAGVLFTQAAPPAGVWIIQRGSVELAVRSGRRRAVVALLCLTWPLLAGLISSAELEFRSL